MSKNEQITVNIVRKKLEALGITAENGFSIDEQVIQNALIKKLLPSKTEIGSGKGRPEFLISKIGDKDFLIVIECKADIRYHESPNQDQPQPANFAVDGVLLYASKLSQGFKVAFPKYIGSELAQKTFQAIKDQINKTTLGVNQDEKKRAIINAFSFIEYHPELQKIDKKKNESPLEHIVHEIDSEMRPFTQDRFDFDVIGNFYGEFIRYTGGDAQGLGIVLTPKHITELFVELARLDKNDKVLDTCCGTGGFLISAMKKMTEGVSEEERKKILAKSLIGIEQEPSMFALAVSNMILWGDGKTNLYQGSCFDEEIFKQVKNQASVGFINPPYSQKGPNLHEWDFVIQLLNALQKNATGIVIVPMQLAINPHPLRSEER